MQSLWFFVSLASQSYGCQLGSEAADAAAFDWLAARHFSGTADTHTFVYVPDQMGGVGLALNRLLLAYHFAALHGRPLVVMNSRRWKAAQSEPLLHGHIKWSEWSEWRWTRGVSLGRGRNATMADLYWPSTSERDIQTHRDTKDITQSVINCDTFRKCGWANERSIRHLVVQSPRTLPLASLGASRSCSARLRARPLPARAVRPLQTRAALPSVALASRLPRYRPSLASDLAQRLLLLPGVSPQMHVLSLHVRGGDSCYAGERPRCRSVQEAWPFLEQLKRCRQTTAGLRGNCPWCC